MRAQRRHLAGLVPLVEAVLQLLAGGVRRQRAVDHLRRDVPEFVLQVRRAARYRIWYELRIVDLQSLRQPTISAASGSLIVTGALLSGKKPGSALA